MRRRRHARPHRACPSGKSGALDHMVARSLCLYARNPGCPTSYHVTPVIYKVHFTPACLAIRHAASAPMQAIQQSRDSEAERAAVVKKPGSAAKGGHGGKLHSTAEVSDDDSYSDDDDAAPQPPHPMLGDVGKSSSKMAIEAYLAAREAAYQVFCFFCLFAPIVWLRQRNAPLAAHAYHIEA